MQVSVETLSKIERRVTVIVPVEKMNEAYNKRLDNLAKNAKVAGFRPGKVPLQVIKSRFGDSARQEALSEIIQSSLYAAIQQEKLNPVTTPTVEPKLVAVDQPLEFVATFEVLPPLDDIHFKVDSIEKQVATLQEADVDNVIEHLRKQHIRWQQVNRPLQEKDQAIIDFCGSLNGEEFSGGKAHDFSIVIGSKTMVPGFEEGLIGMAPDEEKTIDVTFPENYFAKNVAGQVTQFVIKVLKVSEPNLPEMNENFIKKLGIKSATLADLRVEILRNLERERDRVVKLRLKNKVFNSLLEQNALEIPKALIEREAKRIHDEAHPHHGQDHHGHTEAEMEVFNQSAKRNVALGILVAEVFKKHQLILDKERVQQIIANMASAYENPTEVAEWYKNDKRARAEIELQIMEEQVVEKLLETTTVTEKNVSYSDLMNMQLA